MVLQMDACKSTMRLHTHRKWVSFIDLEETNKSMLLSISLFKMCQFRLIIFKKNNFNLLITDSVTKIAKSGKKSNVRIFVFESRFCSSAQMEV